MSASIRRSSRIALIILLTRVPLAAGLLCAGGPKLGVGLLAVSELLLVAAIMSPRLSPRPVSS